MELFSRRFGHVPKPVLALDSMSPELRNAIWNVFMRVLPAENGKATRIEDSDLTRKIWSDLLNKDLNAVPRWANHVTGDVRKWLDTGPWHRAYDFAEFVLHAQLRPYASYGDVMLQRIYESPEFQTLLSDLKTALEFHGSGYRLHSLEFVPITSEQELTAVERGMNDGDRSARDWLEKAVEALRRRPVGDYNSCAIGAIHAVEAQAKCIVDRANIKLSGKSGLGDALKAIRMHLGMGQLQQTGFEQLYAWASQELGRHGRSEPATTIGHEDAVFVLVTCSAFVSYLVAKEARLVQQLHAR